jgi:hypothetical protein
MFGGTGGQVDTIPQPQFQIVTVASTAARQSMRLDVGRYQLALTNQDASHAITVQVTDVTVDSVQ